MSIARTECGDQCGHVLAPGHTPESLRGFEHGGTDPAEYHRAAPPPFHVALDVAGPAQEALDGIRRNERPLETFGQPESDHRQRFVEAFAHTGGRTRMISVQSAGQVLKALSCPRDVSTGIGPGEGRPDPRLLRFGEMLEHVAPRVDLTALHQRRAPEGLGLRGV